MPFSILWPIHAHNPCHPRQGFFAGGSQACEICHGAGFRAEWVLCTYTAGRKGHPMKKRTLITFLGNNNYRETTYVLDDTRFATRFMGMRLA